MERKLEKPIDEAETEALCEDKHELGAKDEDDDWDYGDRRRA